MSKYHVAEAIGRWFVIMDTDDNKYANHLYFKGYDFMGSVIWEKQFSFDYALSSREEAEQIISDLESADEPAEPAKPAKQIVINTDDLFASLKTFMESIGCTNIQITDLDNDEIERLKKNATEI